MTARIAVLPSVQRARKVARVTRAAPLTYPLTEETAYVGELYALARGQTVQMQARLIPRLEAVARGAEKRLPRMDDRGERLSALMGDLKGMFGIATKEARRVAGRMLDMVSGRHAVEFGDKYRGLIRVNPMVGDEKWLPYAMELATERNVALIQDIPAQLRKEAERVISDGIAAQRPAKDIAEQLVQRAGVMESRAIMIARDQTGKWFSDLQRLRQIDAGVVAYVFSTSRDERVRRRHAIMEGRRIRWDDPPPIGPRGERLHPGQDYLCRCVAAPSLDEDEEEAEPASVIEGIQSIWHWAKR